MIDQSARLVPPQEGQAPALSLNIKVSTALTQTDTNLSLPAQLVNDSVIVSGSKHRDCILQEYERDFGNDNPTSIITWKKGKQSTDFVYAPHVCVKSNVKKF